MAAERQGQIAAVSMLGEFAEYADPPFFWSQHYEQPIRYVGHAETWDTIQVDGSLADADVAVRFGRSGRLAAAATLGRDMECLEIGEELIRGSKNSV